MHNRERYSSSSMESIKRYFIGISDSHADGPTTCNSVRFLEKEFTDMDAAEDYAAKQSYYMDYAVAVKVVPKGGKKTKTLINLEARAKKAVKEYETLEKSLDIAYGRTSKMVKCPHCGSQINRSIAKQRHYDKCPVCGSTKIISDSNWNTLKRKKKMMEDAEKALGHAYGKAGYIWVAAWEYHT